MQRTMTRKKRLVSRQTPESFAQAKGRKHRSRLLMLTLAVSCLLIKALIWLVEGKEHGMCGDKTSELKANTISNLNVLRRSPECLFLHLTSGCSQN